MALSIRLPVPRFVSAGEIFFEKGSIGILRGLNAARIAIIASGSLLKNEDAKNMIKKAIGLTDHILLAKPAGEPHLDCLAPLIQQVSDFRPDWIVGIGGGAAIDSAKLIWTFYEHPDLDVERACRPWGLPPLRGKARFVAAPTTMGTGSEVSSVAVFIDRHSHSKRYFVSHELLPDIAILDPALSAFTPISALAASGLDALAHAIEGYVSKYPNTFLDAQAEQSITMIFRNLTKCLTDPSDFVTRSEMMMAASMAGWVQNLKVPGLAHAIAHQLGDFDIPHGHACGILLGASIRVNSTQESSLRKYDHLAERLGLSSTAALAQECDLLLAKCGLGSRLGQAGNADPSTIWAQRAAIAEGALNDACAKANPKPLDANLVISTLEAVL